MSFVLSKHRPSCAPFLTPRPNLWLYSAIFQTKSLIALHEYQNSSLECYSLLSQSQQTRKTLRSFSCKPPQTGGNKLITSPSFKGVFKLSIKRSLRAIAQTPNHSFKPSFSCKIALSSFKSLALMKKFSSFMSPKIALLPSFTLILNLLKHDFNLLKPL